MKIDITNEEHEVIRRSLAQYSVSADKAAGLLAEMPGDLNLQEFVRQFREEAARARALHVRFLLSYSGKESK